MKYKLFIYFNIILTFIYLIVTFKDYLKGKQQQKKYNKRVDNKELTVFGIPVLSVLIDVFLLKKFNMKLFMGSQIISYAWFLYFGFGWMIMSLAGGNF